MATLRLPLLTCILPLLAAAACSPADARDGAPEDAGSAPVVRNTARGAWAEGAGWRLRPDLEIGGAEAEGPAAFGTVVDVEADALGRLWVADAQASEIRVFDAAGKHVRTIGRSGTGPGEFTRLLGMAPAPDGRMWVLDTRNARFTVFDTAGAVVATHPRSGAAVLPWRGGFDAQGRLYDVVLAPTPESPIAEAIVRYDASFTPIDTLPVPAHRTINFASSADVPTAVPVPFTGARVFALDPQGDVWMAVTDRYRADRVTFAGDTVLAMVQREHAKVPVTDADVDRVLQAYGIFEAQGGKVDRSRIPRSRPPVNAVFTDPDGHLWVSPLRPKGEPFVLDVFGRDGRYLGAVELPLPLANFPTPVVRDGALYGVTRDDLGAETVVRMRIETPS